MSAATAAAVVGATAAVASAGVGIANAAGAFSPGSPNQVNYGQTAAQAEQDQINLLPNKLAASQQYDPALAAVQQQINYNNLFGTPGGPVTTTTQVPVQGFINGKTGQFVAGAVNPGLSIIPENTGSIAGNLANRGSTQNDWEPFTQYQSQQNTTTGPATPGTLAMIQQAQPIVSNLSAAANTANRTANVNDVATLGPAAMAALRNFNPQNTAIQDSLASQANQELAAGSSLTPAEQRQDSQYVRQGQAARGLGMGPTDVFTEAMTLGNAGQQLLQQRQGFAQNVSAQQNQEYGDPFLAITGSSSGVNTNPTQFNANGNGSTAIATSNPGTTPFSVAQGNVAALNNTQNAAFNQTTGAIGALTGNSGALSTLANINYSNLFGNIFGNGSGTTLPSGVNSITGLPPGY